MTDTRGFTLIELMVVILIIAFITTLAVPAALNGLRNFTFLSRVREVVSLLEEARTQAIASRVITQDDNSLEIPPGGYGVFISVPEQTATLFIDSWNAADDAAVNMDYFDLTTRTLPDGIYTAGQDQLLKEVAFEEDWLRLSALSGTELGGTAWAAASDNEITVTFQPPYAEVILQNDHSTDLADFTLQMEVAGQTTRTRSIFLHRVTTTPQLTSS